MTIERFAIGWGALVAWSLIAFSLIERGRPRHHHRPGMRRVAVAATLLAINAAIAQAVLHAAHVGSGRVAVAWLAIELAHYAMHRAMHRVPLLWRFHRLHHAPEPLVWTTAWYVHPVDATLSATSSIVAALAVGGSSPMAAWFIVTRRIWSIVLHANLEWPTSPLDALVATPAFHALHHREDLPPGNFASTLPVLDRMFGTYHATAWSADIERPRRRVRIRNSSRRRAGMHVPTGSL
jgi:sterol desaturase/sphingolipid hydroxylase (fatty acid hydroxylase superfamily)